VTYGKGVTAASHGSNIKCYYTAFMEALWARPSAPTSGASHDSLCKHLVRLQQKQRFKLQSQVRMVSGRESTDAKGYPLTGLVAGITVLLATEEF